MTKKDSFSLGDIIFITSVVIIALLFRRYDAFDNPQIYAEDGKIFLQQYKELGIASLFKPYAGYLHTVPRLVALLWGGVDYIFLPACYNYTTLVITTAVAIYLYHRGKKMGLKHPVLFGTAFLFLPLDSEIFMNLTNVIWITSLAVVVYVFTYRPEDNDDVNYFSIQQLTKLVVLIVFALTGPCALLLSPIILLKLWMERKKISIKNSIPLGIILICGAIQVICMKLIDPGWDRRGEVVYKPGHFVEFLTNNIKDLFFLNKPIFLNLSPEIMPAICFVILAALVLVFLWIYKKCGFRDKYVLLLAGVLYFASFIVVYWPNEYFVLALHSARYYFIPYACIALIVIVAADKKLKNSHIALYLAFISFHGPLIAFALPDKHWKAQVLAYKSGTTDELQINPDGWSVKLPKVTPPYKNIDYQFFDPKVRMEGRDSTIIPLWSSNPVSSNSFELPKGKYTFVVVSNGSAAGGIYPHLHIALNDREIGDFYTTKDVDYSPELEYEQTNDTPLILKLRMDNDTIINNEDRNAFTYAIKIIKK